MNVLALCAGVGGLERGVQFAIPSAQLVAAVEREAYAVAVLAARMASGDMDQAPIWSDLRTFDGSQWRGIVDLITAGYPCKGESSAGSRSGTEHEFWLWDEVWRVVCEVGPRYVFLENVAAHLGRSFRHVLGDLAEAGWSAEWQCVRASDVGAPHIRDRVFILAAHSDSGRRMAGERDIRSRKLNARRCAAANPESEQVGLPGQSRQHGCVEDASHTDEPRFQGAIGRTVPIVEPSQGSWANAPHPKPTIRGVDDGLACGMDVRANRLYVCGNGVVPEQAAAALRVLWARLHGEEP